MGFYFVIGMLIVGASCLGMALYYAGKADKCDRDRISPNNRVVNAELDQGNNGGK